MATETLIADKSPKLVIFELSRKEAADLIGLLTAQLAGVHLVGNATGSPATFSTTEHGQLHRRYVFTLEPKNED